MHCPTALQVVLSSDEPAFGGYSNVTKDSDAVLKTDEGTYDNRPHSFQVRFDLPRRSECHGPTGTPCRRGSSSLKHLRPPGWLDTCCQC